MVPGFNTDFKYRGQTFHVQTEDNGVANPVVVTLLYHKGAILASRKTSYRELLGTPEYIDQLKEMMKSQHKALMRELLAGAYDAKLSGTPRATIEPSPASAPPAAAPSVPTPSVPTPSVPAPSGEAAPRRPEAPAARTAVPGPGPAVPRRVISSLDEAIMRYLEEHATAAAAAR